MPTAKAFLSRFKPLHGSLIPSRISRLLHGTTLRRQCRNTSYRSRLGHFHSRLGEFQKSPLACAYHSKWAHACMIGDEHAAFQLFVVSQYLVKISTDGHSKCWLHMAFDMGAVCLINVEYRLESRGTITIFSIKFWFDQRGQLWSSELI